MNKKPFYKCWWFWLIIGIAFLLCVGNIVLAHFIKNSGANIFTAVSGWVSGIATAILGIIAVVQNKSYKEENDRVLQKQSEENTKFIESQKDISWRNTQYQLFTLFLSTLNKHMEVVKQYNFGKIHNDTIGSPLSTQNFAMVIYEKNILIEELFSLKNFLMSSKYYYAEKEEVFNSCLEYYNQARTFFEDILHNRYDWYVNTFMEDHNTEEKMKDYSMLKGRINQISELDKNFRGKLLEHINQLNDMISDLYGISSEDLKALLEKSNSAYNVWINKVKKQEEQNNG